MRFPPVSRPRGSLHRNYGNRDLFSRLVAKGLKFWRGRINAPRRPAGGGDFGN